MTSSDEIDGELGYEDEIFDDADDGIYDDDLEVINEE